MTESLSADVQRPITHSGQGTGRSIVPTNLSDRHLHRHGRSNSAVIDLASPSTQQNPQPAKRRKLDDNRVVGEDTHGERDVADVQADSKSLFTAASDQARPSISFSAELAKLHPSSSENPNPRLPPLPIRPWKRKFGNADITSGGTPLHQARDYGKVQATPFRMETPARGPKYRDNRVADFAPWAGKHSEDTLTEQTVRNGYYDRPISQNETGTARPSLYSIFKHKSGLSTLSTLFLRVVEQKDSYGKIGTTSSFKPPPRVTLTEAKRKAWLSDLADSDVPLRKLSRTIPQGIRGRQLLEQCLTNMVPIGRAVWFAKCVGANEIRTLKRKGTSGTFVAGAELKWLQEWTAGVEHFLEDIISNCGGEKWRTNMAYALDVISRFYSENMLDKDHFIDWIVNCIAKVDLNQLPIWIIISRGFWEDIIRLRSHGRIFSRAILRHLKEARDQDTDDFSDLIKTLSEDVQLIARRRSLLLVLPDTWEDCEPLVELALDNDIAVHRETLAEISGRNKILKICKDDSALNALSSKQMIIEILDSAQAPYDNAVLSQRCQDVCQDHHMLVSTVLEWCSTPFRTGKVRKYLAIHLLRKWHAEGTDIEQPVRDIIMNPSRSTAIDLGALFRITGFLIRLRIISVSRYLQIVISTGVGRAMPDLLRLIHQAPTIGVPSHVRNLRKSVLTKAGYLQDEEEQVENCKMYLSQSWPTLFPLSTVPSGVEDIEVDFPQLSECIQAEISQWILHHVKSRSKSLSKPNKGGTIPAHAFTITVDEFLCVRSRLEEMDDVSTLAECLHYIGHSDDELILTAMAETINAHFAGFSALEELLPLCTILGEAYQKLRSSPTISRTLTISLLNLAKKLSFNSFSMAHLLEDLARGDRTIAIAACSPISDHMAENLQQAGSSFLDEYDQLLSGGNIMDDQTMARLFWTLAERIETSVDGSEADKIGMCQMIVRLMAFRPKQFDQLLHTWFKRMMQFSKSSPSASIKLLIASGVTSVRDVIVACKDLVIGRGSTPAPEELDTACQSLSDILRHPVSPKAATKDSNLYRLGYSISECLADTSADVRDVLMSVRDTDLSRNNGKYPPDYWGLQYTIRCLPEQSQKKHLSILSPSGTTIVADLLGLSTDQSSVPTSQAMTLLDSTDAFSLPLRKAYMKQVYDQLGDSSQSDCLGQLEVINHLFGCARRQTGVEKEWTFFVATFGPTCAQHIRQRAEEAFFAIPPPYVNARSGQDSTTTILTSEILVDMVDKTAFTVPDTGTQSTAASIVDRFAGLFRYISSMSQNQTGNEDVDPANIWTEELSMYFSQLLRLTALHKSSFSPSSYSASTNQWQVQLQIRILLFLTSITVHPSSAMATVSDSTVDKSQNLVSRSIDILTILSDNLSEESRLILTRHLKDRMRDPRARTLFGSLFTESIKNDEELVISREANLAAGKEALSTEYKVKSWEMIQGIHTSGMGANSGAGAGAGMNDTSMSLSLFQGRVLSGKNY